VLELPLEGWRQLRLDRDDRELALYQRFFAGEWRIVADWPLSGTGDYELRLTHADGRTERRRCRIESTKIGTGAYVELLTDLESRLPTSIVLSLKRLGALTGVQVQEAGESALGEEMVKLRRAIDGAGSRPGLAAILGQVARDPYRVATATHAWVDRDRARRVDPNLLCQAVAAGGNLDGAGLPLRLPEARTQESVDVYENRLLKTFKRQVELRLGRLEAALRGRPTGASRDRALSECEELRQRLAPAAREASFLAEVESLRQVPERVTMVLLNNPAYHGALEGLLDLHRRAGVRLDEPKLEAPLEQLPSLYETWGALQAIDVLLALAAELGFDSRRQQIARREPGSVFVRVLPGNRAAVELRREADETVVRLFPQRHYQPQATPFGSTSFLQRPDVAIEVERSGNAAEICLFDPKYKLASGGDGEGRPKKEDVDTMHAYRDAIRDAEGRRVISHASILYPGESRDFGEGLGAISALPGKTARLREQLRATMEPLLSEKTAAASG
jgi:hypothetical protein